MKTNIINGINNNQTLLELRQYLVKFKEEGGTQKEAIDILYELRNHFQKDEAKEDRILELLDFATGWCNIQWLIWT